MTDVLSRFQHVKRSGTGWTAKCPAHEDRHNSLSINTGEDGRWLLKCHAQCAFDAILTAAGLSPTDLFPESSEPHGKRIVATFDYRDEQNTLLYQVVRFHPKSFRQRAADGAWSVNGIRRVPYRLPELKDKKTVFITEGEKDALALWAIGLPATTNAGGAGKWQAEFATDLKNAGCRRVIVLPDNDPPGTTHAVQVARMCLDAQLEAKLIPLPGLPPKGDVSDYLRQHSKGELLDVVKNAPLFDPQRSVTAPQPTIFTSIADFLMEPDERIEWLVEDRIPAGSIVMLVAPPKTGKSTTARELAYAISAGQPWLGWRTYRSGAVWLLIFEDKRSEVRKHLRKLGATGDEPIRLFVGQAPAELLPQLHDLAAQERPTLIVVDTLARLLKVRDFNDYAEVTRRFQPLLELSRSTGSTLLVLHHASSHGEREGLDAVLGSTALSGSVDNILILKRHADQVRTLSSVQRIGPDLDPTVIELDKSTGRLQRAGTKREYDDADLGKRITQALSTVTPVTERALQESVMGKRSDQVRVLRQLIGLGRVRRIGTGGKKDPYRYLRGSDHTESTQPQDVVGFENSYLTLDVPGNSANSKIREQEKKSINPGLFEQKDASDFEVPAYSQIPGNNKKSHKNGQYVRTPFDQSQNYHVEPPVIEVPDDSETESVAPSKTANQADKHWPDSCSRKSAKDDDERL